MFIPMLYSPPEFSCSLFSYNQVRLRQYFSAPQIVAWPRIVHVLPTLSSSSRRMLYRPGFLRVIPACRRVPCPEAAQSQVFRGRILLVSPQSVVSFSSIESLLRIHPHVQIFPSWAVRLELRQDERDHFLRSRLVFPESSSL